MSTVTSDYLCVVCGEHANEHGAIPHQFVAKTSKTVTFDALPLGARFRYPGKSDVWVKLENGGCGIVAEWNEPQLNWPGQGIYSFADSEQQRASGQVEWIDRSSDETFEQPTREEALRRIEEACRSIEILCDHFGMDPAEFLADSRSQKALKQHKPGCPKEAARIDGIDRWYTLDCDCGSQSEETSAC